MEDLDSDLLGGSYGRYAFVENQQKADIILVKVNLKRSITSLEKSWKQKWFKSKDESEFTQADKKKLMRDYLTGILNMLPKGCEPTDVF